MRLTVRTLLAWLDGVLGPAEHGELAEKVAASPAVRPLIDRVESLIASPALSAPAAVGRGLADDPNTAAEFLDNVLDSDRLAAFERVCIESDLHLADVASCHRMLAELHRDPATLEPFAVANGRAALTASRAAVTGPLIDTSPSRETARARPAAVVTGPRRGTSWLAWLSAAVALLLLLSLGGVLVMLTMGRGGRPRQMADAAAEKPTPLVDQPSPVVAANQKPAVPEAAAAVPADDVPPVVEVPPQEPGPQEPAVVEHREPPMPSPEQPAPDAVPVPPAPVEPPVPGTAATPPAARTVPHGEAMAIGGGAVETPPAIDAAAAEAASPPRGEASVAGVRLVEGVVLARGAAAEDGWKSMTPAAPEIDSAERLDLVAPLGVYPLLLVDGVTLRLHPGTRAIVTRRARAAPVIDVAHGRVVVDAAGGDSWPVISAGGLHGELGVMPRQPVGIEVGVSGTSRAEPGGVGIQRSAIHTAGAAVVWRQSPAGVAPQPVVGIPAEMPIPAMTALRWDGRDPAAVRPEPCPAPAWMGDVATSDRVWRGAADDLVAALAAVPPAAAVDTLRRRAASGLPEDRGTAAATLAILGQPTDLVALLCDEPPRGLNESQWVALEAASVPMVLSRGGVAAESLLAALRDTAPDGAAVAALAAPGGEAPELTTLLDGLDATALVVRRYSILRLRGVAAAAGHTVADDYRGDHDGSARRDSVARWRSLVEQGVFRGPARPEPGRSPNPNGR